MKWLVAELCALALVSLVSLQPPIQARTAAVENGPFGGNTSDPITLTGTVSVKVGTEVFNIRNEHGFPISLQARERASHKNAGESL